MTKEYTPTEGQPFYVGEHVIAVDALPGAGVKNGLVYVVYSCETGKGQDNNQYWYVGVEGNGYKSHNRITPRLFRSIEQLSLMMFEKVTKEQPIHAN